MRDACHKKLDCGHFCYGTCDDEKCMPCLHEDCVKES